MQSYRTLHLAIQGFLVAAGVAVLAVQLAAALQPPPEVSHPVAYLSFLYTAVLAFLFWIQWTTSNELQRVITSRTRDIDYWHRLLILSENRLEPTERAFTSFKIAQQSERAGLDHLPIQATPTDGLSDEQARNLIEKGLSHTRRVLDVSLFRRLKILWLALLVSSALVSIWFVRTTGTASPHHSIEETSPGKPVVDVSDLRSRYASNEVVFQPRSERQAGSAEAGV